MKKLVEYILVASILTVISGCKQIDNSDVMDKIKSQSSAINRAIALTGLDRVSKRILARQIIVTDDNTPFLAKQFDNRDVWSVEFNDVSLTGHLKSAQSEFPDAYQLRRKFLVLIDAKTGQLLEVKTDYQGKANDMKPEPDAASAEDQLKSVSEIYAGLPSVDPKVTFLDALDIILARGVGSPLVAKEINGLYIMDSRMKAAPRPVWVITLRGLPPMPSRGPKPPSGKQIPEKPVWMRNTLRNVIDSTTGEWLFATNVPQ